MNWGISLLKAFVSAGLPCERPYFCPCVVTCVSPAAVLKLYSALPPPPALLLFSFTEEILNNHLQDIPRASSKNSLGRPDRFLTVAVN